jgi:hypothetical protein
MIQELSNSDRLNMSLSQINRYEKKYLKLTKNNSYYIQYYGYDVVLNDWSMHVMSDGFTIAKGYLGNGNAWETSGFTKVDRLTDHYACTTESGTVYRLYYDDSHY